MPFAFEDLPRRIFLDSCTAQMLGNYGSFVFDGEDIPPDDRIFQITNGPENLSALRSIFLVSQRALFEWIVSAGTIAEARDKRDPRHMRWIWDIADHSEVCLEEDGPTAESLDLAKQTSHPKFGYLSEKDKRLIMEAVALRCEAFLTVERRLPQNAVPIFRELGLRVITPVQHWEMLRPWAALWL